MKIDFSRVNYPRERRLIVQAPIGVRKNRAVREGSGTQLLQSVDFHDLTPRPLAAPSNICAVALRSGGVHRATRGASSRGEKTNQTTGPTSGSRSRRP
jgi:hypothetical protein